MLFVSKLSESCGTHISIVDKASKVIKNMLSLLSLTVEFSGQSSPGINPHSVKLAFASSNTLNRENELQRSKTAF